MSAETINGYTLLAEPADWADHPQWVNTWETEIAGTLRGNEGRSALREHPRPTLKYKVQPMRIETQARLVAALTDGLASGKCCAPTFGRASWLAADVAVGAAALSIEPSAWAWAVNDWLLVYTADGGHQTTRITAIGAGSTAFTVAPALAVAVAAATAVYPLFFGRPELSDFNQTNGSITAVTISLIGEKFFISPEVPAACTTLTRGPNFDFAVVRYLPNAPVTTQTLMTNTALIAPALESAVGQFAQGQVPAAAEQFFEFGGRFATQSQQPYLFYGGRPVNPQPWAACESVLINFGRLAADYPAVSTIQVRLRACWAYNVPADAHLTVQLTAYKGGTMQGGNYHGDSRGNPVDDFTSTGGTVVGQIGTTLLLTTSAPYGSAGQECGTLVYTPATNTLAYVAP